MRRGAYAFNSYPSRRNACTRVDIKESFHGKSSHREMIIGAEKILLMSMSILPSSSFHFLCQRLLLSYGMWCQYFVICGIVGWATLLWCTHFFPADFSEEYGWTGASAKMLHDLWALRLSWRQWIIWSSLIIQHVWTKLAKNQDTKSKSSEFYQERRWQSSGRGRGLKLGKTDVQDDDNDDEAKMATHAALSGNMCSSPSPLRWQFNAIRGRGGS